MICDEQRKLKELKKEAVVKIMILMALFICLTGCGRQKAVEIEETVLPEEISVNGSVGEETTVQRKRHWLLDFSGEGNAREKDNTVKEIPFDFSFKPDAAHKEVEYFSLALARFKKPAGEYELRLYDQNGDILQRVPCGALAELIEISSGDFDHSPEFPTDDIVVFSSDASEGLYIQWNREESRFYKAIEIPRYTEIRDREKMLVEEDGEIYQKKVYELDRWYGLGSYEVRCLSLDKATGELEIRDCLDNVILLRETANFDNEGNLINKEYYDMLLWEDTYSIYDSEKSPYSWTMIRGEWTEDGEWVIKYESREKMLESLGFADSEPVYQYYDWHHNLRVELYMDEAMEHGCGIDYEYSYNSKMEKVTKACGFVIESIDQQEEWVERDFYSEISLLGPEHADDKFEEIIEYTPDGKPDYYQAQGLVAFNSAEGPVPTVLLELEYVYRDDGSLCYRYFLPYQRLWGSVGSTRSFFDEKERLVYEEENISYEPVRHYYIYQEDGAKPTYHLEIGYYLDDADLYPVK